MEPVNIQDARARLSQWVDRAASGEDVVICRNGKPLARITRLQEPKRPVRFGLLEGKVSIAVDFDATMPGESLAGFEGR